MKRKINMDMSLNEAMNNEIPMEDLIKSCRTSAFSMYSYNVNINFHSFIDSMLLHTWDDLNLDSISQKNKKDRNTNEEFNLEWLKRITPEFQRSNDKWNEQMKTKFIENILKGAKTELLFFNFNEHEDSQVIDGLQRTTAIIDFFNGKIKPFGKDINELFDHLGSFRDKIEIRIYTFKEWKEVGKFYIDMNENITHSKEDIQKAKDWFLNNKNIVL